VMMFTKVSIEDFMQGYFKASPIVIKSPGPATWKLDAWDRDTNS